MIRSILLSITFTVLNSVSAQNQFASMKTVIIEDTKSQNSTFIGNSNFESDTIIDLLRNKTDIHNALIDFPNQRPFYNRSFKYSAGTSLNTLRLDKSMQSFNDTSEHHFSINGHSPIFSFTQEFAFDSTFSLSYSMGYSQSNIYFDNEYYGSRDFFISLNPQLFVMRHYNFEYYIKLKIGVSYSANKRDELPSEILQRLYPSKFHMFTGATLAGINYLFSDNLALNAEFSIWSAETVSLGLSYRFMKQKKEQMPDFKKSSY